MRIELRAAPRVILPGVGAAADAMLRLESLRLVEVIRDLRQPVLGICLGMQLLFEASEEGDTPLPRAVARRGCSASRTATAFPCRTWAGTSSTSRRMLPLTTRIARGEYVYFVHSYRAPVGPWTVATSDYGGEFSAAVRQRNFHGAQFHPERSGQVGARLLASFLEFA